MVLSNCANYPKTFEITYSNLMNHHRLYDNINSLNEQKMDGYDNLPNEHAINDFNVDDTESRKQKEILIQVENIENIDVSKIKEVSIKMEFKGQVIGESENISISEDGERSVDFSGIIPVEDPSPQKMDDILANPVLFTVIDRTTVVKVDKDVISESKKGSKKESKKAESRASLSVKSAVKSSQAVTAINILGYCNLDIGSFIKGEKLIKEKLVVELEKISPGQSLVTWPKLPRISVRASTGDEKIISDYSNKLNNIINITIESVYNAPGNIQEGTLFDAHILVPCFGDTMNAITFPNGVPTNLKDCEYTKKWLTLSHVEGRGALTKHKINLNSCDITNHENEVPDLEKTLHENGPRIQWNKWRSAIMVKTGSNFFFRKLARNRVWPLEIAVSTRPASQKTGKTEKRAKTASASSSMIPERYVAYLRLNTMLYPGVTRARVASRLYLYSPSDIIEKCGVDFVSQSLFNISTSKVKNGEKTKSSGKENEKSKTFPGNPLYNENGKPVFVVVEVEVWKSYIPKREPEFFFKSFSSYFPPKEKLPKKQMNLNLARSNFAEVIENMSHAINECYRSFELKTVNDDPLNCFAEEKFFRHLCEQEIFQKIKVLLEDKVVDLVGEAYGDIEEIKEKIPDIFIYLINEMRKTTNQMIYKQKHLKIRQLEADDLQLSAEEAIEEGNYKLAKRYLLQKLSSNKLNPDHWLDYALYLMVLGEYEKSAESIREALSLDLQHQMGLLMYALILTKLKDLELAELTFQVLLAKYPNFIEGWVIFHLFYSTFGDIEGADFTLQMAFKIDCEEKSKESFKEKKSDISFTESERSQEYVQCDLAEGNHGIASYYKGRSASDPLSWTSKLGTESSLFIKTAILLLRLCFFEFAELALTRDFPPEKQRNSMQYMYYLAVSHYLQGQYNQSISHLLIAVEKFGKNCFLWSLMGHCYYKLQSYDNCIECFEYVIESYNRPKDIHLIYIRMGIYYMKTSKYKCAKKMFLSACKYSPSSETWLGLGIACYNLGEFEEAEGALTEANFLDYMCPVVWGYLTLVNIQLRRYDVFSLCYVEAKKKNLKDQKLIKQIETLMEIHSLKDPVTGF